MCPELFVAGEAVKAAVVTHAAGGVVSDVAILCGLPRKASISSVCSLKIYLQQQWEQNPSMSIWSDYLVFGSLQQEGSYKIRISTYFFKIQYLN